MKKKILAGLMAFSMLVVYSPVAATTAAELQALIDSLMKQVADLQAQLATLEGEAAPAAGAYEGIPADFTFEKNLFLGDRGNDVKYLQIVLNADEDTQIAASGAGSPGNETTYFGRLTQKAVVKFQKANGLTGGGWVGPKTRALLNDLLEEAPAPTPAPTASPTATPTPTESPTPTPTPVVGTGLTVALASDTPAATVVASGTAFNPAVKLSLTASTDGQVKVTGLTVKKAGLSPNTYVSGVDIIDAAGKRHGNVASSLTADNTASFSFTSDPITIAAGSTDSVTIRFNITNTAGTTETGTIQFGVSAITTDGAAVSGTLPIWGTTHSITEGTNNIATIVLDEQPVNASGVTLNVNTEAAQEIAKFSVQESSSNEDIKVQKLTIYNNGTAADADYKDVELVAPDGTILATAQPASKYVVFDLTASPYTITKGLTKNFTVKAKLVNGASRTIQFIVYNDYDLEAKGVSSGALVLPSAGTNDTAFPIGNTTTDYNKVTIGSGTVTFNKAADSPSSAVSVGDADVVLAKYDIKANGENMELRGVKLYIQATDIAGSDVTLSGTVFVKYNDATIWSGATSTTGLIGTAALADSLLISLSLSSYPVMTAGAAGTLTVVGSIGSAAEANDTVQARVDITSVKRLVTNDITDPTVSSANSNQRTVKGLALTVTTLSTPVAASVVTGTTNFELARISLDASNSGEDVKVSTIKISDTLGGSAAVGDIANLKLYDASAPDTALTTTTSTSVNATSNTFTFTTPLAVSKTTLKTLILKGDVVADADGTGAGTHTYKVTNADGNVTATGATTGNSVVYASQTISGTGQAMTIVSAGTLSLSLLSGTGKSPSANQNVTIGTQGNVYFAFKMTSQFEAQKITSLKLTASGTNLSVRDLVNIGLYADVAGAPAATPFASAPQFDSCSSGICTKTWTATDNLLPAAVQPASPATIYVKADTGGEGTAILGDDFVMKIAATADVSSKGAYTGTAASSITGTPTVTGISYVVPFNVAVEGVYPSSGTTITSSLGAGTHIARFKVTNNGSGQITLTNVKFTDSGSHGADATYTLYASNENGTDYTNTTLETSATDSLDFASLTTSVTINGGAYRYLTVALATHTTAASGDSFTLSAASLGDLKYSVTEANLGYSGNADADLSDTISSLNVSGTPAVGTIYKQ